MAHSTANAIAPNSAPEKPLGVSSLIISLSPWWRLVCTRETKPPFLCESCVLNVLRRLRAWGTDQNTDQNIEEKGDVCWKLPRRQSNCPYRKTVLPAEREPCFRP